MLTQRDDRIDQGMQQDATGVRLVTIAFDHPCMPQTGNKLFRFRGVAVDMTKALLAFDDILRTVKAALRQQRRQNAIRCGFSGMKGFATGPSIELHACGLRCRNAHRVDQSLRVELDEPARRNTRGNTAQRAGRMPAARVVTGRG